MIYEFSNYSLDLALRELRCDGQSIHVEPQTFDVLHYLVTNRERVVSKDDLIAEVWKGRIVSEFDLEQQHHHRPQGTRGQQRVAAVHPHDPAQGLSLCRRCSPTK